MEIRQTSVESYVVRIYRREPDHALMGIVEWPARDKKMSFQSFEELQAILMQVSESVPSASAARHGPEAL